MRGFNFRIGSTNPQEPHNWFTCSFTNLLFSSPLACHVFPEGFLGHVGIDEARVLLLRWMKVRSAICSLKLHTTLAEWKWLIKNLGEKRLRCVLLHLSVMVEIPQHLEKSVQVEWSYPMTSFQIRVGKCNLLATAWCLSSWYWKHRERLHLGLKIIERKNWFVRLKEIDVLACSTSCWWKLHTQICCSFQGILRLMSKLSEADFQGILRLGLAPDWINHESDDL